MKSRSTKTVNNRRLRKRWYVNASANLPFLGKTNVAFGTTKAKRSLVPMVKAITRSTLRNTEEAKHYLNNAKITYGTLTNDTIYSLPLHAAIAQGDSDNQRDGDRIRFETLKLNMYFYALQTSACKFRVMIIKTPRQPGTTYAFSSGPIGQTDVFYPNIYKLTQSIPDPKKCTVLFDKLYSIGQSSLIGNGRGLHEWLRIPLNTTFTYQTDNLSYGKFFNYALLVIPDVDGVASAASIPQIEVNVMSDLIFKEV